MINIIQNGCNIYIFSKVLNIPLMCVCMHEYRCTYIRMYACVCNMYIYYTCIYINVIYVTSRSCLITLHANKYLIAT